MQGIMSAEECRGFWSNSDSVLLVLVVSELLAQHSDVRLDVYVGLIFPIIIKIDRKVSFQCNAGPS
jgi:hypothetical protein